MRFLDDSTARPKSTPALKAVMSPTTEPVQPDKATMDAHLARSRYGRFTLTEAVRPGWQLDVVPQAGYRLDTYVDPTTGARLPAVIASVSREDLFETFLQLLEPLGDVCDVVLESSHATGSGHEDFNREGIERTVLESVLWDFEDLLLQDGCTGIAVMHPESSLEVQFDEHKLLVVYAPARLPFETILRGQGIPRDDRMRFISQGEHLHTSHAGYARQFAALTARLGAV